MVIDLSKMKYKDGGIIVPRTTGIYYKHKDHLMEGALIPLPVGRYWFWLHSRRAKIEYCYGYIIDNLYRTNLFREIQIIENDLENDHGWVAIQFRLFGDTNLLSGRLIW